MLNAKADSKCFVFKSQSGFAQHAGAVICTVATGKNDRGRGNFFSPDTDAEQLSRGHGVTARIYPKPVDAAVKVKFHAHLNEFLPHLIENRSQPICADMGLLLPENFFGSATESKNSGHQSRPRVFDTTEQLAIRERARSPFAKGNIRFRVKRAATAKILHFTDALR